MFKAAFVSKVLGFYPIRRLLGYPLRRQLAKFQAATHQPCEVQEALLRRILTQQADTDFARDHRFADIRTVADYRRQLPISRYEYFEPYMARVRRGDFRALLAEPTVHMFALTSGTTAARKYIPVTPQYLADYRRGWNLWGLCAFQDHPQARLRPIVQLTNDWDEFRTEANIPCGSITGLTAHTQKRFVRWLYCVPPCTGRIRDARAKYYVALRLSVGRQVGLLTAANPSTLVQLARTGDREKEALIRDLRDGTLSEQVEVPPPIRAELARHLQRDPRRARELEAVVERTGTLYPRDFWGNGRFLIGTWTGGTVGNYLRQFPAYFGEAPIRDIGLLASEGRMTIPLADGSPAGVLDITSHYFEFIPEEEGDQAKPSVRGAHELEEGRQYFIVPTTAFGLYRYHICDLVRVTGFHNRTPLVEFLSKGSHFASITGEKLSEYQVVQAMTQVTRELQLSVSTYSLAPCWDDRLPYYGLFVERGEVAEQVHEALTEKLDRCLAQANTEYASKRDSQRLDAVRLQLLPPGTWSEWDRQRLTRTGGTLEQYKHPCLIGDIRFHETMKNQGTAVTAP